MKISCLLFILISPNVSSFVPSSVRTGYVSREIIASRSSPSPTAINEGGGRYDKELEIKAELAARERAAQSGSGVGETAAGAILGGLVLGPFGALFGASVGSSLGRTNAIDKAKKDELARMGVSEEMLENAREMGAGLERGMEGLRLIEDSLATQQQFAKRLDAESENIYSQAKEAIERQDEETARNLLMKRNDIQEKLKKALLNCADEKKRLTKMQDNVRAIEERAIEMESLLKRSIGAKTLMDTPDLGLSLTTEDPLIQKFRDMGIDR